MRTALIVNPLAGSGRGARRGSEVAAALLDCQVIVPANADDVASCVREVVAAGAQAVLACGGDGTVHEVLQGLMSVPDAGAALGIIPAGSGDDIARALDMAGPHALERMKEALLLGRTRMVDASRITSEAGERWSLGVISCGFDSAVNERANAMTRVKGKARYLTGIIAELGSFRPVEYSMRLDSTTVRAPAILVAIGNGGTYGGGMRICPDARIDDGLLDITWLHGISRTTLIRLFPRIYSGSHVRHPAVATHRGTVIDIDAAGQLAYADGERIGSLPIRIEALRGAVSVLDTRPA